MAQQMTITQRNFAVKRIRDLYASKLKELAKEDTNFTNTRKDAMNVTRAQFKEYFEKTGVTFAVGEPTDVITKVSEIFDVKPLIVMVKAKANTDYPAFNETQRVAIEPLTSGAYADYHYFHSVDIHKRAQNLVAAYIKAVDIVMLGDSATATVMVEKATLATY